MADAGQRRKATAEAEAEIAVCGLDCSACGLLRASLDPAAAEDLVGWFRTLEVIEGDEGAPELMARGPYRLGCRGDRSVRWSEDCSILTCCIDDKGLTSCHECDVFPCGRLSERAETSGRYADALDKLRSMRADRAL